jgi:hypothetical protein
MKKIYLQPDTKLLKSDLDIFMVDGSIDSNLDETGNPKPSDGGYDDGEDEWGGAKDRNPWENDLW